MGPIVFADPAALARLNAIVWPEIARMAMGKVDCLWKVLLSTQTHDYQSLGNVVDQQVMNRKGSK